MPARHWSSAIRSRPAAPSASPDRFRAAAGYAQQYGGTIAGFGASDTLDLRSILFGGPTTLSYAGNTSSGVATVMDGTHTAHLSMVGDYTTNSFHLAADNHGGTAITFV